jgi:hypothetical protein
VQRDGSSVSKQAANIGRAAFLLPIGRMLPHAVPALDKKRRHDGRFL